MTFFKNNTAKGVFSAAMTFAVRVRIREYQSLLTLFLFSVYSQETFLGSFYPCRLQISKGNFFELPSKLVTVREIAEPKVTVLIIYVFSVNQSISHTPNTRSTTTDRKPNDAG